MPLNTTITNESYIKFMEFYTRVHPYPPWLVIFLWLLTALLSVATILGNLLVLLAYRLERNIRRQLSNKFIVSLAITDLIIGMEGFPLLTVYVVGRERWPLGDLLCQLWLFLDYTLCLVSILNVLLITVDRYGSVCYPAKYRTWQTRSRARMFIFVSWIVPCILFGTMIFAWEPMTGQGMDDSGKCYAPFLNDPYVNMAMYIIYYWTTLVAMSVLYRGIHTAAKALEDKSKARERQTIALLLGQRCMAQVGVGMLLHSSASDEDDVVESFFHPAPTVDNGYHTEECTTAEMIKDTSTLTVSNIASNSGVQDGYEQLRDDDLTPGTIATSDSDEKTPLTTVPVILTPISPSTSSVHMMETPTKMKQFLQRRLIYKEFGDGEDEEDVSLPFIPLLDDKRSVMNCVTNSPSSTSWIFNTSPNKGTILNQARLIRRSSSLRRVLAPVNNYGGISKAPRSRLIGSLSLDENNMGPLVECDSNGIDNQTYKNNCIRQNKKAICNKNSSFSHKSSSSLHFYDSYQASAESLYCDASLHSVFDFGTFVSSMDITETPQTSVPGSMESSVVTHTKAQPNGDLNRQPIKISSTLSSVSSSSSSKWTQSGSSQASIDKHTSDQLSAYKTVVPSASSPAQLINVAEDESSIKLENRPNSHKYSVPSRPSVQIKISPDAEILTPIMEEEKSTPNPMIKPNLKIINSDRRESSASNRGKQGTKRYRHDQKIVHLTVPGSSSTSADRRTGSKTNIDSRRSTNASEMDFHRGSWQSTTSSMFNEPMNHTKKKKSKHDRRLTQGSQVDDDEDSCASGQANRNDQRAGSSNEGQPERKSSNWLINLFNNPTSILNRKRKVTKAERRARKAFRTITVIVGTFALFWSPYYIVATVYGFCPECVPAPLFLTSYYLCYLNSSVNPFAYAFANRLFRKTFIRILRGDLRRT